MATLKLYNANDNFDDFELKLAKLNYDEYLLLPESGTFTAAGVQFTIDKETSPGFTRYDFTGKLWWSTNNFSAVLHALGLSTFRGWTTANLFEWYPAAIQGALSPDAELCASDQSLSYPNFTIAFDADGSAGGGDLFSDVEITRAYGATERVTSLAMDDHGTTRYSVVGYMDVVTGDDEDAFGGHIFGLFAVKCWKRYGGDDPRMEFTLITSSQVTFNDFPDEYSVDPGDKGFKPTTITQLNPTTGGGSTSGGSPSYPTDTLTQPGAPDETHASAAGSGLLNAYVINKANLAHLCYNLFSPTWTSAFTHLFWEPLDSIISLQVFPCTPDTGTSEYVKVLGYMSKKGSPSDTLRADWEDSQAAPLTNQFKVFDFGDLSISEMFESFLDYDASDFTLFLPFIGEIAMPVGEVMGSTINVQYTVDFFTGMCVANVLINKSAVLSNGETAPQYAQHSYMGNCAVQMPLTSVQYGNVMGSLAQAASMGLKTGLGGAAGSLAMSAANGGFRPTVTTKGTIGANAGFCGILQPYITITRPIPAESPNYQNVTGYPSYVDATLGTCDGFCKCTDIDLTNVAGITNSEMERVKNMCLAGVYV